MCPAVTKVSLFAIAIVFPASIAVKVGINPTLPKIAFTRILVHLNEQQPLLTPLFHSKSVYA